MTTHAATSRACPRGAPGVFRGSTALLGLAHWVPERRVTATELGEWSRLPVERALRLMGLRETRVAPPGMTVVDAAMRAVEKLQASGRFDGRRFPLAEIDLILYHGIDRDYVEPATAVFIQERLGIAEAMAFDVGDACLGFTDAWCVADAFIAAGRARYALLVGAELLSKIAGPAVAKMKRTRALARYVASLTAGDAASAALIGPAAGEGGRRVELLAGLRRTFAEYSHLCTLESSRSPAVMHAGLIEAALEIFPPLVGEVLGATGWSTGDIGVLFSHQASLASLLRGAEILGLEGKVPVTFDRFGNNGSVGIPLVMSLHLQGKAAWQQEPALIVGFGSGLGIGAFTIALRAA